MEGLGPRIRWGFLRWLAEHYPDLEMPILTGVWAGAINTAHLANHQGTFREKVKDLAAVWGQALTLDRVFRVDAGSIAGHVARWGVRLLMGTASHVMETRSLIDASPLQSLLEQVLKPGIGCADRHSRESVRAPPTCSRHYGIELF